MFLSLRVAYSADRKWGTFFVLFLLFALILLFTFISIPFLLLRFFPPIVCYFHQFLYATHLIFHRRLRVLLLFRRCRYLFIFFHNNQTNYILYNPILPHFIPKPFPLLLPRPSSVNNFSFTIFLPDPSLSPPFIFGNCNGANFTLFGFVFHLFIRW